MLRGSVPPPAAAASDAPVGGAWGPAAPDAPDGDDVVEGEAGEYEEGAADGSWQQQEAEERVGGGAWEAPGRRRRYL